MRQQNLGPYNNINNFTPQYNPHAPQYTQQPPGDIQAMAMTSDSGIDSGSGIDGDSNPMGLYMKSLGSIYGS
jgi:hypothetical protein